MLVTDVGDEMFLRQLRDVGDGFGRFCHQHSLNLYLSTLASGTNIKILSLTSKNCHQDKVTNNYVAAIKDGFTMTPKNSFRKNL